jgi:hypothetical protein
MTYSLIKANLNWHSKDLASRKLVKTVDSLWALFYPLILRFRKSAALFLGMLIP